MAGLLEKFRYCPECGSSDFKDNDFKSRRCGSCGFTYYLNSAAAVAVFIENAVGDIMVCRRAFEPAAGTLDLIGGFVDPGETLEEAAVREVKEEAGIDISPESLRFIGSFPNKYVYSGFTIHTCDVVFVAKMPEQQPVAADDASEILWISSDDIPSRIPEFGFVSIREALKKYCSIADFKK